jgi:hypothetical protein
LEKLDAQKEKKKGGGDQTGLPHLKRSSQKFHPQFWICLTWAFTALLIFFIKSKFCLNQKSCKYCELMIPSFCQFTAALKLGMKHWGWNIDYKVNFLYDFVYALNLFAGSMCKCIWG